MLLHKVTATEQLAYDATLLALRRHYADRSARWVFWTLKYGTYPPTPHNHVAQLYMYTFQGKVELKRRGIVISAVVNCMVREYQDGSREIYSVESNHLWQGNGWPRASEPLGFMRYIFGEKRPRGAPRKEFSPKYLADKLTLSRPPEEQ